MQLFYCIILLHYFIKYVRITPRLENMIESKRVEIQFIINILVKLFLFPLFIVGLILRYYDKIFKKEHSRKRKNYNFWY